MNLYYILYTKAGTCSEVGSITIEAKDMEQAVGLAVKYMPETIKRLFGQLEFWIYSLTLEYSPDWYKGDRQNVPYRYQFGI